MYVILDQLRHLKLDLKVYTLALDHMVLGNIIARTMSQRGVNHFYR